MSALKPYDIVEKHIVVSTENDVEVETQRLRDYIASTIVVHYGEEYMTLEEIINLESDRYIARNKAEEES